MRPYRKWTCPPIEIPPQETDIWMELRNDSLSAQGAVKRLMELRDTGVSLSQRSLELLALDKEHQRLNYIQETKDITSYVQPTLITCMDVMKKDSDDIDAISLLLIGTEAGQLYILPADPQNSTILCRVQLPSPPTHFVVQGIFDVEWRISIICRDCKLYAVKNGDVRGSAVLVGQSVDLNAQAVSMIKQDKLLWIALMDRSIACYSTRGKRMKSLLLQEDIQEIAMLHLKKAKLNAILLIALATGEILLCKPETIQPFYSIKVEAPINAMITGYYGREEHSMILIHGNQQKMGSLTIKMWKRTVDLDQITSASHNPMLGPPREQEIPLQIPKKTKLFVEQTQRERESSSEIHRAFQRDLCKLRLTTARAYVKTLTEGLMMVRI
jgi:Bardet-Biedl syndrome 1 protein